MAKKNGLLLLAVGAAGGYLAAKYGKQFVETVKGSVDKQPIEDLVDEIKKSVKQGAEDIKKSVEDMCHEIEKSYFDEGFLSMAEDYKDYESEFADYADEEMNTPKSESTYFKVPVVEVEPEKVEEPEKVDETEELPPLDVKISENPEEVRKAVVENLNEAEKAIAEETKPSASEVLKKRRESNMKKTKKTVVAEVKEEVSEPVEEVKDAE